MTTLEYSEEIKSVARGEEWLRKSALNFESMFDLPNGDVDCCLKSTFASIISVDDQSESFNFKNSTRRKNKRSSI